MFSHLDFSNVIMISKYSHKYKTSYFYNCTEWRFWVLRPFFVKLWMIFNIWVWDFLCFKIGLQSVFTTTLRFENNLIRDGNIWSAQLLSITKVSENFTPDKLILYYFYFKIIQTVTNAKHRSNLVDIYLSHWLEH